MNGPWVVVLEVSQGVYGPVYNKEEADLFAAFLATEVDPATVYELKSPTRELLAWHAMVRARGGGL